MSLTRGITLIRCDRVGEAYYYLTPNTSGQLSDIPKFDRRKCAHLVDVDHAV